tara:strand:+ start:7043 stop:8005 length:963 start_codon:yes stop_codon:yes gene_type:complete
MKLKHKKIPRIKTQIVKCFNCKKKNYSKLVSIKDYGYETSSNIFNYVKCKNCSNIYLLNRPQKKFLNIIYDEKYPVYNYKKYLGNFINSFRDKYQFKKIEVINKYLKNFDNIIDVGSGGGDFLRIFRNLTKKKLNYYGLDFSDLAIRSLKSQNFKVVKKRFETLDVKKFKNFFGAICMFQILEHLEDPNLTLKKAYKLLRKKGVIIIETPNINTLDYNIFGKYWGGWHAPRHWNIMEKSFLEKLLIKNNFKIITSKSTLTPFTLLHSFQYLVRDKFKLRYIANYFETKHFIPLTICTILDFMQFLFTKKTSNTQIIAVKN